MKTGRIRYRKYYHRLPLVAYKKHLVLPPYKVKILQIIVNMHKAGKAITFRKILKSYLKSTNGHLFQILEELRDAGVIAFEDNLKATIRPTVYFIPADVFFSEDFNHDKKMPLRCNLPPDM